MIINTKAHPRAALVGNPSDGFFGKTISFIIRNFAAEVKLYETPELEILPNTRNHSCFNSIAALSQDVRQHGYYGGLRLLKATVKRFHAHCQENNIELHSRNELPPRGWTGGGETEKGKPPCPRIQNRNERSMIWSSSNRPSRC